MKQDPEFDSLPANVDAEKTLLGAVLLDNRAWDEVALVPKEAWSLDSHLKIRMGMKRESRRTLRYARFKSSSVLCPTVAMYASRARSVMLNPKTSASP